MLNGWQFHKRGCAQSFGLVIAVQIFSNWVHPLPPESEHSMETLCADVGRDSIRGGVGRRIHRPRPRRVDRMQGPRRSRFSIHAVALPTSNDLFNLQFMFE
jgi:hypothetical protein